ncbi:hypothetical protein F4861DRAFT_537367 [Xylaria intraflava]|nr:hypothetical protein F4861DRAFT_537367 [Xylaria intraflava]
MDNLDIDEYLPASTMQICEMLSRSYLGNIPSNAGFHEKNPYLREYDRLRQDLRLYTLSGQEPVLSECVKPQGSWDELRRKLSELGISLDALDEVAFDDEVDDE